MAAYQTQQINVGSIAAPDVGSVFANFADRINKQQSNQLENMRQAAQYDRQQVLNQRADQEWNRQQGIIQAKKDVASEFAKNPYAEIYGGKQENAGLDKQVLDYVNNGGEINEDLAKRLQGLYEQHKPFREDAKAAVTQQLIAKGLDASEAEKEAAGVVGNLPSRVELQTRADAQRKAQQEYYDNVAKANVEAMKINTDIWGKQANISNDQYLAMVKNGMGTGGSGAAGGGMYGKTYGDVQNEVGKLDISPSWAPQWASLDENVLQGKIAALRDAGVPPALVSKAIQNSVDVSAGGKNVDQDLLAKNLANLQGSYGKGGNIPQAPVVSAKDLMPAIAGYNVVDYNPNTLIDRARQVAPELFKGDPNKIVEETKVSNPITNTQVSNGNTLADRNNNPGNLRINPRNEWQGGQDGEKGFVKFDTPELGARALAKTINNNVGMTVKGFINKYAPPSENDTGSYIDQVSKRLGKDSSSTISKDDIPELMKVIAKREGGSFTNDQLMGGYKLFLNETTKGDKPVEITSTDKAYDRISNIIEPALAKDVKVDTQEQKQELVNKYDPIIQKVEDNFKKNGGGPIDDQVAISKLMMELKIPKGQATRMYQEITEPLQQKAQVDNYYNQFGGVGVKTQAQQDEINSKVASEPPLTMRDAINWYVNVPGGMPWIANKVANGVASGIKAFENQDSTDRLIQKLRASTLAEKYKSNPASLTTNERNWILQSKTTPNGRKQLKELGIE